MRVAQFRRSVECNIARINSAADIVLGHHESMLVARGFTREQPCAAPQRYDRRDGVVTRVVRRCPESTNEERTVGSEWFVASCRQEGGLRDA
jgi:hypothetical protein